MNGVPWSHFEAQLALRGDVSVPRISYLDPRAAERRAAGGGVPSSRISAP